MTMAMAMTALAAACGGDSGGGSAGSQSTTTGVATTAPSTTTGSTAPATNLTLRITDVRLVNSEESDSGMRVLLPAGVTTASVTLTGLPTPNQVISVCQARQLESRFNGATCRSPANGEAVTVALGAAASGVEVVQVGTVGAGPAGNSAVLDEVTIRYAASSRELSVRLPQIAAGDGGGGGRPTFSLTPPGADGAYRATLTWMVIPVFGGNPTNGQIELLQGGAPTNQAQGGGEVRLSGNVAPPVANVALRVQNLGGSSLVAPKLALLLP